MLRGQSIARPDRTHIATRQHRTRFDIFDDVQGTPEYETLAFLFAPRVVDAAERPPSVATVFHQPLEFVRLQAEGGVGAAIGTPNREVLLDDACAQRDGRNRTCGPGRVIRKSDDCVE